MEKKKIKILFVLSDRAGVSHYRCIWPAQHLKRHHKDEVDVKIDGSVNTKNIDYLSKFDIIHFHRQFGPYEESEKTFKELRDKGVTLIMDIDDYWSPPPTHHLYEIVKADKLKEKVETNLKHVDYVTTTTDMFADLISEFNPNTEVLPNALNMKEQMWKGELQPNESDKLRISWIGGSSHLYDLMPIQGSMGRLISDSSVRDKFQFVMCGFDTRGTITEVGPNGQRKTRKIEPHETVWMQFEKIFTNDYMLLEDKDYEKWLKKIKNEDYDGMSTKNYVRRWTLPLTQYGRHYDYCDVCLAPIAEDYMHITDKGQHIKKEHIFNKVKSELKIIESGMKKKALVAQDFGIYKDLIVDGETGILVSDNKKGWHKALKSLILDKDKVDYLANNLHEFVKNKYSLEAVNEKRLAFYKRVVKEKQEKKEKATA
jgi:glycosyltransferase involved in cell wall biosynthesis